MKNAVKKWVVILDASLILFVILNFEYLRFNLKSFIDAGLKNTASLPIADNQITPNSSSTLDAVAPLPNQNQALPSQPIKPPEISPYTLRIDSLNITAPIVYVYNQTEKGFQAGLKLGVVHYPGTALPGELGNVYIFGHSSDYFWSKGNYKTIFAPLPKMRIGETIIISDRQGQEFIYTTIESKKVSAKDLSVLSQQGFKKKLLTLQTSYPVGTALARWVVVAEMK